MSHSRSIASAALLLLLCACGAEEDVEGREGELGRGRFWSACQVSESPFAWDYQYAENDDSDCPMAMIFLDLAQGSTIGLIYYSDYYSYQDDYDLVPVSRDFLEIEDNETLTVAAPGLSALLVTSSDTGDGVDFVHLRGRPLDYLDIEDVTYAYLEDMGNPSDEEEDSLSIYGAGYQIDVVGVMRASDGRPLGGRRVVEWEASGDIAFEFNGRVDRLYDADITYPVAVVSERLGSGVIVLRDVLTGIETSREVVVR